MLSKRPLPGRAAAALLLLGSLAAAPLPAAGRRSEKAADLLNPLLSVDYALWLAGPIARMATEKEIEGYLELASDEAAKAAIEEFWNRRDSEPAYAGNPRRELFEERALEADRLYAEAGIPGRRTDRGTVYVLQGAPEEERFDISEHPDDPPIIVWTYPGDAPPGLDGKKPERFYRFIRRGDVTTFFTPNRRPPRRPLPEPP